MYLLQINQVITVSQLQFLKYFLVETFQNALSEFQEQFNAVDVVPFLGKKRQKEFGFFVMLSIFFPGSEKTQELPVNLNIIPFILFELK